MVGTGIQKMSAAALEGLSATLSRSSQGISLSQLENNCPKLAKAFKAYQGPSGTYYRCIGNARMECAQLRFGQSNKVSATLITNTPIKQSVYMPRYTAAVGVLMTEPTQIHSVNHTLNVNTPPSQSAKDIQEYREAIVTALRKGYIQRTIPRVIGYGTPRQENVNESIVDYTPREICALVVPKSTWEDGDNIAQVLKGRTMNSNHSTGIEQARLSAQLAYVTAKLGDLPILTFDGSEFENLNLATQDWQQLLTHANKLADHHIIDTAIKDSSEYLHSKATGFKAAMAEASALEQPFDMHELKHIGGLYSSIPINVGRYLMGYDK